LPALYLAQSLLFLVLLSFLVFLGTEVRDVGALVMRGAIFLVAAIFFLGTALLGLARGGARGAVGRVYGTVSVLFLLSMTAVQAGRAVAIYPKTRRVETITEWFPALKRRAWWEQVRGPIHEMEYLLATGALLLIILVIFIAAWRRLAPRGASPQS
jgi:hypothetical protein